jgi:hypothetical protein
MYGGGARNKNKSMSEDVHWSKLAAALLEAVEWAGLL